MKDLFIQIGASRDGREVYLDAARRRGLQAVLVEATEYISFRRLARRCEFDSYIEMSTPADETVVWPRLQALEGTPRLVLAGFERYTKCAHRIAFQVGLGPCGPLFDPPSKIEQRTALRRSAPHILQPAFWPISDRSAPSFHEFRYPAVLKPVDGGGGLGVVFVDGPEQLREALAYGTSLRNYDNSPLSEWLLEEFIEGDESSVQGICCGGMCHVLSICSKVVVNEPIHGLHGITGFREAAHVATGPTGMDAETGQFVQRSVEAIGYREGPFHIDLRHGPQGPVFIEMGFRLSGAAVTDLVRRVSGCDWGESAFSWMLGEGCPPQPGEGIPCAANVLAFSEAQIEAAIHADSLHKVNIERIVSPRPLLSVSQVHALAADLSRHAGPIARIQICGGSPASVRRLAEELSSIDSIERSNSHEPAVEYSEVSHQ